MMSDGGNKSFLSTKLWDWLSGPSCHLFSQKQGLYPQVYSTSVENQQLIFMCNTVSALQGCCTVSQESIELVWNYYATVAYASMVCVCMFYCCI
jgi:hypothetical protein